MICFNCSYFYLLSSYFTYKVGTREKDFTALSRVLSSIDQGQNYWHGLSFLKFSLTKGSIYKAVSIIKSSTNSIFFSFNVSLDRDKPLFTTEGVRLKFWLFNALLLLDLTTFSLIKESLQMVYPSSLGTFPVSRTDRLARWSIAFVSCG